MPDRKTMEAVLVVLTALLSVAKAISELVDEPLETNSQTE